MINCYLGYRFRACVYQLRQLLTQLRQFGLMVILFTGPALPSVIFLLVLALGLIVRGDKSGVDTLALVLLCLLGQGMITWAQRPAILDLNYRQFGHSLISSRLLCTAVDLLFSWLLNPLLLASVAIAVAMTWQQHMNAPHFMLFIIVQLLFGVLMLYRPLQGVLSLAAGSFLLVLPLGLLLSLVVLVLIVSLAGGLPSPHFNRRILVDGLSGFWLEFIRASVTRLLWRMAVIVLLVSSLGIISRHRPDFTNTVTGISAMVTALVLSSIQFDVNEKVREWRLFFTQLGKEGALVMSSYTFSLTFLSLGGLMFFSVSKQALASGALVTAGVLLIWLATKRPALYAPAWFFTSALLLMAV